MKKQTFINIVNTTLFILIKHQDAQGLFEFNGELAKNVSVQDFTFYLENFLTIYAPQLTEEDCMFFENAANSLIQRVTERKEESCVDVNTKLNDENHLRKIKKGVKLLETLGWKMGVDYSFKDGDFYMSAKNKKKLREILNK
jgi:hypothetical protein